MFLFKLLCNASGPGFAGLRFAPALRAKPLQSLLLKLHMRWGSFAGIVGRPTCIRAYEGDGGRSSGGGG